MFAKTAEEGMCMYDELTHVFARHAFFYQQDTSMTFMTNAMEFSREQHVLCGATGRTEALEQDCNTIELFLRIETHIKSGGFVTGNQ